MSKIKHRIPDEALTNNMTGRLDPAYEAEVAAMTERREEVFRRAERAVEAAEKRFQRARSRLADAKTAREQKAFRAEVAALELLVEERKAELNRLHDVMRATPAAARHRGTKSYKPVPTTHGGLI